MPERIIVKEGLRAILEEEYELMEKVDASVPFSSEEDFLTVSGFDCFLFAFIRHMKDKAQDVALKCAAAGHQRVDHDGVLRTIADLEALRAAISVAYDAKLALHLQGTVDDALKDGSRTASSLPPLKPRLLRICEKYGMTEKETKAMRIIAWAAFGRRSAGDFKVHGSNSFPEHLKLYASMTISELAGMFRAQRDFVVEGVLQIDTYNPVSRNYVEMMHETICVVSGTPLKQSERLKIDNTKMAKVIEDEDKLNSALGIVVKKDDDGEPAAKSDDAEAEVENSTSLVETSEVAAADVAGEAEKDPLRSSEGDIFDFFRKEKERDQGIKPDGDVSPKDDDDDDSFSKKKDDDDESELKAYKFDVEYVEDFVAWAVAKGKVKNMERNLDDEFNDPQTEQRIRQMRGKVRVAKNKLDRRLALTKDAGAWYPRLERLAEVRGLSAFEKHVLVALVGQVISRDNYRFHTNSVGDLLQLFCNGLKEEIDTRPYFYKSGKLVREGLIQLSDSFGASMDLSQVSVSVDRRVVDFVCGLDSEMSDMVEGSHCYLPKVSLDQVKLPEETKTLIVNTVRHFDDYKKVRKTIGLEDQFAYGTGIALLFYGASGVGKTLMANAIGHMLHKKILLINFTSLGGNVADQVLRFIFREARLSNAIVFFDECDQLFKSRDEGGRDVNVLLTELERHDGLCILATNKPHSLDEAMHRRITLAVEFRNPDPVLREQIWRSHVENLKLDLEPNIDWRHLAVRYDLSGGFIKNSIITALSNAIARDSSKLILTAADLEHGAKHQLRGRLRMVDFDRRVVPTRSLDDLVADDKTRSALEEIVHYEKARQVMIGQWGFSDKSFEDQGSSALFFGPPGTGKTMAAEVVGYELGRPLKVCDVAQMISKWVGETSKNLEAIFLEAKALDAVLVFDEAEGLFARRSTDGTSSTDRYANADTGALLQLIERFSGVCILISNLPEAIDPAFMRRIRFSVPFGKPNAELREKLWRATLPSAAPLKSDVDFKNLSLRFNLTGGEIKNCCFRAAARAALRRGEEAVISMDDLVNCAVLESNKNQRANAQ